MPINQLNPPNNSQNPPPLATSSRPLQAPNADPRSVPMPKPETQPAIASEKQIQQAVEQIQQTTEKLAQNLQFSIDKDTGITVIKVMDSQTQEVIRQIPTEEAVSIARTLDKVKGLLFSDKA